MSWSTMKRKRNPAGRSEPVIDLSSKYSSVEINEGKAIIEAIANAKGVYSNEFIARAKASGDKDKLMLIEGNSELRADLAESLEK